MKVNILGTEYTIVKGTYKEYGYLADADGYTDTSIKTIIVDDMTMAEGQDCSKKDLATYQKTVIRHEIIHAFLHESGLDVNSSQSNSWASNEEMVDWFAIQSPKIFKAFEAVNCL